MATAYAPLGTVSHGTLRTEDLIAAFANTLDEYTFDKYPPDLAKLRLEVDKYLQQEEDERDEDEGQYILEDLFDALGELAPPYAYFGAHEGDGACFGFWPSWDAIEGDKVPRITDPVDLDTLQPDWTGCAMFDNDHGNVTFYEHDGQSYAVVWEIV